MSPVPAAALAAVLEALPAHRGMPDVLELGCGDGSFAAALMAARPGLALLAIDSAEEAVAQTAARGVPAKRVDAAYLLAPDDSYDVVVALELLEHVAEPERCLAEVVRVLRSGGRFVVAGEVSQAALEQRFAAVRRLDGVSVFVAESAGVPGPR